MGMASMKDCLTAQDVLAGCSIKHACHGGFGGLRAILDGRNDGGIVVSQAPDFNWNQVRSESYSPCRLSTS